MKKMTCAAAAMAVTGVFAVTLPEPTMRLPLMRSAPSLDGEVKADEWRDAHGFMGFCRYPSENLAPIDAQLYLGRTADRLYVATVCEENPNGVFAVAKPRVGNVACAYEDTFEFVFVPDRTAAKQTMKHIIFNYLGAYQTQAQIDGKMIAWVPEGFERKATKVGNRWHMEMSLPLADLGFKPGDEAKHAVRLCRNWRWIGGGWGMQTSLRPNESGFFAMGKALPCDFGDAPAVQVLGAVRAEEPESTWKATVRVTNPTAKALKLHLFAEGRPVNSQPGSTVQDFELAPGATKDCPVSGPILGNETVDFKVTVADAAGGAPYYFREVIWSPNAPAPEWVKNGESTAKVGYKFAYYPSYNKMRLVADLSKLEAKDRVDSVSVAVRDAKKRDVWTGSLAIGKDGVSDTIVEIPDLRPVTKAAGDGAYTVTFEAKGVKDGTVTNDFRRDNFEWEGNKLGLSDTIPAPFTPIERCNDGWFGFGDEHVKTILRDHTIGENGLWKQVVAAGKEILARPMRLVSRRASASDAQGAREGTRTTVSTWDVDGMMRWDLTLKPGHYEPMTLEIPLRAERAKLYHACADGMRFNDAGEIPAGQGVVWDSSKAPRTSIVGDYIPYLWVGGPLRGIAVFGENDRGWVTGGEGKGEDGRVAVPSATADGGGTPSLPHCQEIVRETDGTVVIRLNLIQRPVDVTEPRLIRLAFQATPVKPMEKNFRASPIGDLVGSCYYWGGAVASDAIAPFDGTDEYLRKMGEARRTGKVDHEYVDRCIKTVTDWKKGTKAYDSYLKCMKAHFNSGHNVAAGAGLKGRLTFYTNGRGVELGIPSGLTFCDEWERNEFTNRDQLRSRFATVSYGLDPQPSYLDYAAWWWKKMLESGACDYLYWDDVFCTALFDLVGTDAYRLPDGTIQPGTGIFNMRACVRRCAVLQAEMGRTCWKNWVHMTNTALAPVLAFAGTNYDWEDVAGDTSLQERYSRASIQAQSLGRQFGNRVSVMGYFATRDKEKLKKLHRWGTGAVITHEIQWQRVKEWRDANKKLEDWGYRLPTTQVWNYWDEDVPFPARITGGESAALAMAKVGDEALIVVSDWDKGGDYAVRPDVATLGLKPGFRAYDLETGKDLNVVDGAVRVTLSKLDYVMIGLK